MIEELNKINKKILNAISVTLSLCNFDIISLPKNFKTVLILLQCHIQEFIGQAGSLVCLLP